MSGWVEKAPCPLSNRPNCMSPASYASFGNEYRTEDGHVYTRARCSLCYLTVRSFKSPSRGWLPWEKAPAP